MAEGFELADFGEVFDLGTDVGFAENCFGVDRRDVQWGKLIATLAGRALLKEKRFVLNDVF